MLKYRICPISIIRSWKDLSENLLTLKYNDESMRGIKLKDVSSTSINGTYYEKILYNEVINHPINGITTVMQEMFLYTSFFIYKDSSVFVLINPNRKPNSIFKFLSINSYNFISMENKEINIDNFCLFSSKNLKDFRVKKVFFCPFNFSYNSIASISVSSLGNALEDALNLGVDLPRKIQKISFECMFKEKKVIGSVTSNGSISISNSAGPDLFDNILNIIMS